MDFSSYINSLPNLKADTLNQIAKETCTTMPTVYRYVAGTLKVPPLKRKIIAKILNKTEKELWPNEEKEKV